MIREIGFVSSYPAIMDSNKIFNTKGENDLFEPFNILKQKLSSKKISINTKKHNIAQSIKIVLKKIMLGI